MAEGDGGGSTGVVAILAIFVIVVLLALFFLGPKLLWGGRGGANVNINVTAPK